MTVLSFEVSPRVVRCSEGIVGYASSMHSGAGWHPGLPFKRADFARSAYAASSLIKTICIPKVRTILDSLGIRNYDESELWFKLLVMHSYHAGAYNVQNALFTFMPKEGNMDLIYNLWHAQTGRFKSASQNYSQLILAAMLEMNERSQVLKNQGPLVKAGDKPSGKG